MTRFAFVTWDGGGNVPPAVGIAQELASRGHEVVFIGYEVQRQGIESRGFGFQGLRRSGGFDIYAVNEPAQRIAGLLTNVWACPEHLDDVPDACAATRADIAVIDFSLQGALAAASRLALPVAVLAHSSIAGLVPPPESPMGAARLRATNELRARAGLAQLSTLDEAWGAYLTLVTTVPALDPAAAGAPATCRYVGPIFESPTEQRWDSPWDPGDDRPLVIVSFTTTRLWDQRARIARTLEGLAGEPVRVLVASQQSELGRMPANAVARTFVPHALVMPLAAVTVTHAGHGTVAASLAHGVPLVALPNPAADQPFLAATIQRLGAGIALDGEAGAGAIRTAVRQILSEASFADGARTLRNAIRDSSGRAGAVLELEELGRQNSAAVDSTR